MEGEESGVRVYNTMAKLLQRLLPPSVAPEKRDSLLKYYMRVLSSTLGSSGYMSSNPLILLKHISQRLNRNETVQVGRNESIELSQRVLILYGQFEVSKSVRNKWAVLKLLQQLLGQKKRRNLDPVPMPLSSFGVNKVYGDSPAEIRAESQAMGGATMDLSMAHTPANIKAARAKSLKQSNFVKSMSFGISEQLLTRDVLFAFQGIDGKYVRYSNISRKFVIDPKISISSPVRAIVSKLCHMGYLFRDINKILEQSSKVQNIGICTQSLHFVVQKELTDFFRLLAVLEAQVDLDDPTGKIDSNIAADATVGGGGRQTAALTLRRLFVWVQDPYARLQLIHGIVRGTSVIRGGALVSAVFAFTRHGDPVTRTFVYKVMREISYPILNMTRRWLLEGTIDDPCGEFFIAEHHDVEDADMWTKKYSLRTSMLPPFVSNEFAKQILQVGTTINFIRSCCGEAQWVLDQSIADLITNGDIVYGKEEVLASAVARASALTSRFVVNLFFKKFELWKHLHALKSYMLLGKGDFVASLMDTLVPELGKPASQLYRHNLLGLLDTAVRASNAQYDDEEVLQRLDLNLYPVREGNDGWSVFALDYRVDSPLNTIFTKSAMENYLRVFKHLWRIKRVAHSLASLWCRLTNSRHLLGKVPQFAGWVSATHLLRNEMHLFMENLQSYLLFEVLETSWGRLKEKMDSASNLDEIIEAHEDYQGQMMNAALLGQDHAVLLEKLLEILDVLLVFCGEHDRVLTSALEVIHRKSMLDMKIERQLDEGEWGIVDEDEVRDGDHSIDDENAITAAARALAETGLRNVQESRSTFTNKFVAFMNLAETFVRGKGQNLHLLTSRMDFNEFYDKAKREAKQASSVVQEKEPGFEERLLRQLGASRGAYQTNLG
jgi:gamma-tubulin complex component 3